MSRRKTLPHAAIKRMIETVQSTGINSTRIEFTLEGAIILSQETNSTSGASDLDRWEEADRKQFS